MIGSEELSESTTWQFFQQQIDSPLTAKSGREPFHHTSKMVHRLFPPLLGKLCTGCSLKELVYFTTTLGYLAGFFFFMFFSKLVRRMSDRSSALLLTLGMCFIFLGKLFFWFSADGFALLGLLLAMMTRRIEILFVVLCMAFWTDERAIVASALVFFWHSVDDKNQSLFSNKVLTLKRFIKFNKYQWMIIFSLVFHFSIRFSLARLYSMPSTTGITQALTEAKIVLFEHRKIDLIPMVTLSAFEGWWLILLLSFSALGRLVSRPVFAIYILSFLGPLLVSYMVDDMTRSIMYAFPAILIAFRWIYAVFEPYEVRKILTGVLLLNVVYPTYYLAHYVAPFFLRILKHSLN